MLPSRLRTVCALLSLVITALLALGVDRLAQPSAATAEPQLARYVTAPSA